jgi:predicted house-cleaning noncanonical NTP pyrophosphatase (MazG superfamily)
VVEKFRNNIEYSRKSGKGLSNKVGEEIIELVEHLEELGDIRELINLVIAGK